MDESQIIIIIITEVDAPEMVYTFLQEKCHTGRRYACDVMRRCFGSHVTPQQEAGSEASKQLVAMLLLRMTDTGVQRLLPA